MPRRGGLCCPSTVCKRKAKDTREERKGPRVDAPQAAIDGFLKSTGLALDQLTKQDDKKGQFYMAVIKKRWPGRDGDHRGTGAAGDPQFSMAQVHALGIRQLALGASPAFDPVLL